MRTWYSRSVWAGFDLLFRPWMHRRLDGIHIRGAEHTRWLPDPPLAARRLPRELEARRTARPDAVFGFFPQGRIWPSHRCPLGFRRGVAWLASRLAPIAVVPVGLHLEPLTRPGPAAFASVGAPPEDGATTRDGFAKNLYLLAGGRPWTLGLTAPALLTAGLGQLGLAAVPGPGGGGLLPLAELVAIRVMAAALTADPPGSVVLHPAGVLAVMALALESWRRHRAGTVVWKGRILTHKELA